MILPTPSFPCMGTATEEVEKTTNQTEVVVAMVYVMDKQHKVADCVGGTRQGYINGMHGQAVGNQIEVVAAMWCLYTCSYTAIGAQSD